LIIIRRHIIGIEAIHPAEHLAEELEALEMSAAELARNTDVPINRITQILNGTRRSQAIQICAWDFFGTSAEFWLNLQSLYDLRLAREEAGKAIKALPSLRRQDQ
jgi:addiction module HigA family antidote